MRNVSGNNIGEITSLMSQLCFYFCKTFNIELIELKAPLVPFKLITASSQIHVQHFGKCVSPRSSPWIMRCWPFSIQSFPREKIYDSENPWAHSLHRILEANLGYSSLDGSRWFWMVLSCPSCILLLWKLPHQFCKTFMGKNSLRALALAVVVPDSFPPPTQ